MPVGLFVFDEKARFVYANRAFLHTFFNDDKKSVNLKNFLLCEEKCECGTGESCAFCSVYSAMKNAVRNGRTPTLPTTVTLQSGGDKLTIRLRIYPVEKNLYMAITDGLYQSELQAEMLSAKKMQQKLLPAGKKMGKISYAYMYIPCLAVGGDMPEIYETDGETYGIITDVSGKGVAGSMLSTFVKAGLDKKEKFLSKAVRKLCDTFLSLNLDERSYITLAGVRINEAEHKIHYVFAGHNAPILLKNGDSMNEIEYPAPPVSNWMPDFSYEEKEIDFESGDILVLLTDGVTELVNQKGDRFGIERAENVLLQSANADDFIAKLKSALTVFSGGTFSDDITAIAFDL